MNRQLTNFHASLAKKNEKTYLEWQKFISGETSVNTDIVAPDILAAWIRCRNLGVDPESDPQNPVLRGHDYLLNLEENKQLIETAYPLLDKLFRLARGSVVALFDQRGYLLHVIGDKRFEESNRKFNWYPGVLWTEEHGGNNTISAILRDKIPSFIVGCQHYKKLLHDVSASSAPIFSPEGELLGGVALATYLHMTHPHTVGMSIAVAQAIENELKARKVLEQRNAAYDKTDIISNLQKAIITYIPDAMIAVDNDGVLYAINDQAKKMFGLGNQDVIGRSLKDIYAGAENRSFLDILDRADPVVDMEVRIRAPRGAGDYTLTCNNVLSSGGAVIGKILIFSEIKRIKSLVTKIIGAKANFKFKDICCHNSDFRKILDHAVLLSESASNVLLLGESGTGKDILAQAIHNASPRHDGPYVAINCAAIPRDLIASELFGHSEGAFTGSRRGGNQGKFELADGGTIFLDEIAEMPLEIQAVLLRVIEDKCVVRIGGAQIHAVDVRIISATNRDLLAEVKKGHFRKDLFYRLNVFNVKLPPLRERPEDIPILLERFIRKYAATMGKTIRDVDDKVRTVFMNYPWPGNVRELQNVVERMVNYASSDQLTIDLIPPEIIDTHPSHNRLLDFESPEETEKRLIRHLLALKFRKVQIAEQLNISRTTLFRKMKQYGLMGKSDG